jgi:hypothetical protein
MKSSPELPGIRMSLTTTSGTSWLNARDASSAVAKLLKSIFSRARDFSSTQRIDRSSSMIQTAFILVTFRESLSIHFVGESLRRVLVPATAPQFHIGCADMSLHRNFVVAHSSPIHSICGFSIT